MDNHNNYQAPRQPIFNGTVFITVLVALLSFSAMAFLIFLIFNKLKNNAGQVQTNEDVEALKAVNATNILASGLKKTVQKANETAAEVIEEVEHVMEKAVEEVTQVIEAVTEVTNEDFNDKMSNFIHEKHPQLLAENAETTK